MGKIETISIEEARRLNLIKQKLCSHTVSKRPGTKELLEILRAIRYLQLDPTNVVCKSHLLVLWSRVGNYNVELLDEMLWEKRQIFEYWAHGASIVLSEDYPLFKLGMKTIVSDINPYQKRINDWFKANKKLADHIKSEIALRGPLGSSEFEDRSESGWRSSGWSNERNVGKMLEILHKKGQIIVQSREKGGHKKWDLAEKYFAEAFPKNSHEYSDNEIIRKALEISLRAMGVATPLQMRDYFSPGKRLLGDVLKVINEMKAEGLILPIEIKGVPASRTGPWYIHSEDMKTVSKLDRYWKPKTTLLSPFDNLIYDRVRTNYLFGFSPKFEAYIPKEERIFGYYVLPILHGDQLIGRIDPEMDRRSNTLRINSIHLEKGIDASRDLVEDVINSISDLAAFLDADEFVLSDKIGSSWKENLIHNSKR